MATSSQLDDLRRTSKYRSGALFAGGAIVAGLAAGWATGGRLAGLTAGALTLAALNGYAKSYSP